MSSETFAVALVTAPDLETARKLSQAALQEKCAACVNLIPGIESHYWWQNQLESATEILLICKTTQAKIPALESCIVKHHPYDTPEFVVLPLQTGSSKYLAWLSASVS
jgi:periplasmic divalent cation tolerance protein